MSPTNRLAVGVILIASIAEPLAGQEAPRATASADRPRPKIIRGEGWAIAAPDDWTRFNAVRAPVVLYLSGDGRKGVPLLDGTLAPVQAGLTVEKFPARAGVSAIEKAKQDFEALKNTTGFEIDGEPELTEIELADGTKAVRLIVTVAKTQRRRLSVYEKVYCGTSDHGQIIATSFVTCGLGGERFVNKVGLAGFVKKHAESIVLDASKVGLARLDDAYRSLNVRSGAALQKTREGNRLLESKDNDRAATVFREALELCDVVSAAHNGVAWSLLMAEGTQPEGLSQAMHHAEEAVRLTGRRDPSALDTLALAHFRKRDRSKAITIIREALKLDPANPDLKRSLAKYEKAS